MPQLLGRVRLVVAAGLAAGGTSGWSVGTAHATNFVYNGFSDTTGLNIVGNAAVVTTVDRSVLRVVLAAFSQADAVHNTDAVTLGTSDTFNTQFKFRFTNPAGVDPADGITFVLAASPTRPGSNGFGMSFAEVPNSAAVKLDTYDSGAPDVSLGYFPQEPDSSNHVAIAMNNALANTAASNVYGNGSCRFFMATPAQSPYAAAGCMANDDLWTISITYNGSRLNVSLSDPAEATSLAAITDYAIDIGSFIGCSTAYVGFTGSTGTGNESEDISYWQFADTTILPTPPSSVPEPPKLILLAAFVVSAGFTKSAIEQGRLTARPTWCREDERGRVDPKLV